MSEDDLSGSRYHMGWRFYLAGLLLLYIVVAALARAPHPDPGRDLRSVLGQELSPANAGRDR
jgi:hypothetical protein